MTPSAEDNRYISINDMTSEISNSLIQLNSEPAARAELIGLALAELKEFFRAIGEQPFRADQLYRAIYKHRLSSFEMMSEFSKELRAKLATRAIISRANIDRIFHSQDGTRRYLFKLHDGREVESVWKI